MACKLSKEMKYGGWFMVDGFLQTDHSPFTIHHKPYNFAPGTLKSKHGNTDCRQRLYQM